MVLFLVKATNLCAPLRPISEDLHSSFRLCFNATMTTGRYRLAILATLILLVLGDTWSNGPAEPHRFATVSALGVSSKDGHAIGNVHYIAIQLDQDLQNQGPRVLFSEISRGSAVGDDWKEGVRVATVAAAMSSDKIIETGPSPSRTAPTTA